MIEWHYALVEGVGNFLISLGLCSLAYLCLAMCIAELAGIVPFSGGSYGYSRCALSPFIGYIVGICDLLQSVMLTALAVHMVSKALSMSVSGHDYVRYLPCWWVALYGLIIVIALPGGRCFWNAMSGYTIMTVVMLLIYCLGNVGRVDFEHNATSEVEAFAGTTRSFFEYLIYPTVCYVGVDFITLYSDEAKEPQRDIPKSIVTTQVVNMVMVFWVVLTCVSIAPGVSQQLFNHEIIFPTHIGYEDIFEVSNKIANFMIAPTKFASASALLFAAGRQMHSMSKSGLLPQCLSITYGSNQVPIAAMLTTTMIGFIVLFPLWLTDPQGDDIYELAILGACFVYLSMFWCFLLFKVHYGSMDRTFVNPLGIISAIFGIAFFSVIIISLLFIQMNYHALIAFVPLMILAIMYYYRVVESRQFFSKEEQQKFMKAYILNANRKKKKGLSPFMKGVRDMYVGCGLEMCCGQWTFGLNSNRDGSSVASGTSNKSNQSRSMSKTSGKSLQQQSSKSNSMSERPTELGSKPFDETILVSQSIDVENKVEKSMSASLAEGDVSVSPTGIKGGKSTRIIPIVSIRSAAATNTDPAPNKNDVNIAPLTIAAVAAVNAATAAKDAEPAVTWSGKLLNDQESRRFFEIINQRPPSHGSAGSLHEHKGDPEIDLVKHLPDKFCPSPHVRSREDLGATLSARIQEPTYRSVRDEFKIVNGQVQLRNYDELSSTEHTITQDAYERIV